MNTENKKDRRRQQTVIYINIYKSPIGDIELFSDGKALIRLQFTGQKYAADTCNTDISHPHLPVFLQTKAWLDAYFSGTNPNNPPPLSPQGTAFRLEVWRILQTIPYGTTVTYGHIARHMANLRGIESLSAQAVGGAVGHNPISIIIPCHRVVGADGSLTGYAGGTERKAWLLALEKKNPLRTAGTLLI